MDNVKKHFQDEADIFDSRIQKILPFYNDMIDALVLAMPFDRNGKIKVVDLGCGTGSITKKVKGYFPNASITCVDFADNMIKIAKNKLADYKDINFVVSDVRDFNFSSGYDAVLSSLTLHHFTDQKEKNDFYKNVCKGLNKTGVFYVADLVLGSTQYLQDLNLQKWSDFLQKSLSLEEIKELKKKYEDEDHPFRLMDEISWFQEAGFCNIEVVWKYYHFAVYGGSISA